MRTLDLLRHLDPERYEFHFLTLSDVVGTFGEEIRAAGGHVQQLSGGPFSFPRRFVALIDRLEIDALHSHVYHASGYLLRLAAKRGVPIRVAHFRSSHDGHSINPIRWLRRAVLRRWIDRYATNILAVSRTAIRSAWKPDWDGDPRCEVIYNGLEASAFDGPADREGVRREFGFSPDCLLAVHVGRLIRPKNHLRLVSIFQELLAQRPEARLLLVGWDIHGVGRTLRRRIEELGLADRVLLCGERSDVPRLLKAADVMIFPSLWEGLPGAVLEACAAGTPVVASDLPSIGEIADRTGGVRCLSLEEPDTNWARAIGEEVDASRGNGRRQAWRRAFARSPFGIRQCAQSVCRVWQGSSMKAAGGGGIDG
jgi:glycosyltransferase involved in cell wall biosynthesis